MKIEIELDDFLEDFVRDTPSRRYDEESTNRAKVKSLMHAAEQVAWSWDVFAKIVVETMGENAKRYLLPILTDEADE
jgi:hypothetical protein